jgi:predicted AlkP superfamily phosphohydrolase/phosphomutase
LIGRLDQAGYRTALLTFPYTYPAEPLRHGVVVPGWDDPEETFASVHPPQAGRDLAGVVPKVPRRVNVRAPEAAFREGMAEATSLKERIVRWAVDRFDPQVVAMVFSETDHASHRYWVEGEPPRALVDVYDLVDRVMGRLMADVVSDEDTVLVVSDHGSWPIHHFVHIAPLLAEGGFLARAAPGANAGGPRSPSGMRSGPGRDRDRERRNFFRRMDWPNTKAFPLGDSLIATGIYVNAPPFPSPGVAPDEYEGVRAEVTAFLTPVTDPDTGSRVFDTVARREDLYRGRAVDAAPDIIVDGATGYSPQLGRILNFKDLFSKVARGGHRREGMYAISAPIGLEQVEPIEGLLPRVLSALSFQVAGGAPDDQGQPFEGYTSEQEGEIERRLQGLGYLE